MPSLEKTTSDVRADLDAECNLDASLEDPMLEISSIFSRILKWMFLCLLILSVFTYAEYGSDKTPNPTVLIGVLSFLWSLFLVNWINLVWWRAFAPRRETDVLYLRSFQNDEMSWPIRVAIQESLGDEVRLSGIRDPRRRETTSSDRISPWMRAMRQCTPKFMDLEAGDDWKLRLWNSLQRVSMAVIDVSKVTPFVKDEILLVNQAIGIERIVFIGNTLQQNEKLVRLIIEEQLGRELAAKATVLMWSNDLFRRQQRKLIGDFKSRFRALYATVRTFPAVAKQPAPEAFRVRVEDGPTVAQKMVSRMLKLQLIVIVINVLCLVLANSAKSDQSKMVLSQLFSLPYCIALLFFLLYNFYVYIRDIGMFRRRVKGFVLMGAMILSLWPFYMSLFVGPVGNTSPDPRASLSVPELKADFELLRLEQRQETGK